MCSGVWHLGRVSPRRPTYLAEPAELSVQELADLAPEGCFREPLLAGLSSRGEGVGCSF
jgi:hypothetical protein